MATVTDHPGEDILASGADVLVCPVNCVGVMGKGLALEFARRFPSIHAHYSAQVAAGDIAPGRVGYVGFEYQSVVLFPTKRHWRQPSRLADVYRGLAHLAEVMVMPFAGQSIAIPALGCGLGGLRWEDVRPLIVKALADLPLRVMLYPPHDAPA